MAINLGAAYVDIVPSTRNLARDVRQQLSGAFDQVQRDASRSLSTGIGGAISNVARGAARTLGDGLATAGRAAIRGIEGAATATGAVLATSLFSGFNRLTAIDDATGKLRGLGHEAESIRTIMASALDSVRGTAFGLGEAATVAATAVAAGVEPGEELTRYLKLVADTSTIAGASLGEIGSIINRTTTSGRVFTMELNQLADRGLPVFQWLADAYGVSAERLREMVSAGEIDATRFREILEENIGGAALASGETFTGGLANVRAALGRVGATLLTPLFEAAKGAFPSIIAVFDELGERIEPAVDRLANSEALESVTEWFKGLPAAIGPALDRLRDVGPALAPIAAAFAALGSVGLSRLLGPFGSIIPTINPVVAAFAAFVVTNDRLREAFAGLGQSLGDAGRRIGEALSPVADRVLPILVEGLETVVDYIADHVIPTFAGLVEDGVGALSRWWDDNGDNITSGLSVIGDVLTDVVIPALEAVGDFVWETVLPALNDFASWIAENEYRTIAFFGALAVVIGVPLVGAVVAYTVAMANAAIATVIATWPILLIAVAVGALAAGLWYAWENWGWFREGILGSIIIAGQWIDRFKTVISWIGTLVSWLDRAIDKAYDLSEAIRELNPLNRLPGSGGSGDFGLDFGGRFDDGGIVPGPLGAPRLALVHGGETILPTHKAGGGAAPLIGGDFAPTVIQLPGEDSVTTAMRELRKVQMTAGV